MGEETSDTMNLDLNLGPIPEPQSGSVPTDPVNLDDWIEDPSGRLREAIRLRAQQRWRRMRQVQIPPEAQNISLELNQLMVNSGDQSTLQTGEGSAPADERMNEVPKTCENNNGIMEDETAEKNDEIVVPVVHVIGNVVALHGKETDAGDFLVQDVLEAGLPPQIELPLKSSEDKYVVFVSGLNVGSSTSNPLQFQLLVDHITGHLGDEKEQGIAAKIVHFVVAGDSIEIPLGLLNGQNLASKDPSRLSEPIKELDILLTQIAASLPLDIMPGPNDPANFSLPQQPLHRCLFPGSSAYNTFRSCTNPHCFELDNIRFLGTSGQNVNDLEKYSEAKDKIEFMERTLRWRHLAPTAPNTLGCYPFTDRDPFFIESCPHVYFVGNQNEYKTDLIKGSEGQFVRLICIPQFCTTGVAVVLNLRNLECHTLSFGTEFIS